MEFNIFKLVKQGKSNRIQFEDKLPFKSVVWEEKFNDIGKVQAVFPKNADTIELVKVGKFCSLTPGQGANIAYIHSVKITDDEIWAYASEAKALWQKKAWMNANNNYGDVDLQEWIGDVLNKSTRYTFVGDVLVPKLGTANLDALEYYSEYEYIEKVLSLVSAGWYVKLDENLGTLSVYIIKGEDRTATVRFATIFGNAVNYEYTVDDQSYMNRVYVVGLDGENIIYEYVNRDDASGELYSAYLDLRLDYPRPEDMTLEDYREAMRSRGRMSLIARHKREALRVSDVDANEFGVEYKLGDIVEVFIHELGITANMRVTGSRRTIEGNVDATKFELTAV